MHTCTAFISTVPPYRMYTNPTPNGMTVLFCAVVLQMLRDLRRATCTTESCVAPFPSSLTF